MITNEQIAALAETLIPFTDEDKKCLQKMMIKQKNRAQLERIIKTFVEDNYCNYRFEKR